MVSARAISRGLLARELRYRCASMPRVPARLPAPAALAVLAALAGSCGGTISAGGGTLHVRDGSSGVLGDHPARVAAALSALAQSVGHPVSVTVDAALASGTDGEYGEVVAHEIEELARSVAGWKAIYDPVLTALLAEVQRIDAVYVPVEGKSTYEASEHAIIQRLRVGERWDADDVLDAERLRRWDARYSGRLAQSVPPEEHAVYLSYLEHAIGQWRDGPPPWQVLALPDLEPLLEPPLRARARSEILAQIGRAAPPRHRAPWDGAVVPPPVLARLAAWVQAAEPTFDTDTYATLISLVYSAEVPLPGYEPLAYAGKAFDAWAALGHPQVPSGVPDAEALRLPNAVREIVVPGAYYSRRPFYHYVDQHPDALGTFARAVRSRNDPAMRRELQENLYLITINWPGPLLQAYEDDPAIWGDLLVRLGQSHQFLIESQAYEGEVLRLWRSDPANRARRLLALCGDTSQVACSRLRYTFCYRSAAATEEASYRADVAHLPPDKQRALQCDGR